MTIGERIQQRRKELNLTQNQLAERMGYTSRTSICTVEKNKEDLTTTRVRKFAEALETTPSYLMGWSNSHTIDSPSEQFEEEFFLDLNDRIKESRGSSDSLNASLQELIEVAKESTPENIKVAISMLRGLNASEGNK